MPGRLDSKVAIVTGSSSGLGRAISLLFHREGAAIVCADLKENPRDWKGENREQDASTPTDEKIKQEGGKAIFVKTDVTSPEDMEALVKKAVEEFGRLDIMINNAGISSELEGREPQATWTTPLDTWNKMIAVNQTGVFLGCKYAGAQMIQQEPGPSGDRGWIVNMCSVLGLQGSANGLSYVTTKHAVAGLTKVVAMDGAPHRVHCNALAPGFTETALIERITQSPERSAIMSAKHPFRGLGRPEDIARAALFLASEDNSWVTGAILPVDGGFNANAV